MSAITVVTFNGDHTDPLNFSKGRYQYPDTGIANRFELFPQILAPLKPEVVCLQELFGRTDQEVQATLCELARLTGLSCTVGGQVAAAKSQYHSLGTGFLWRPGLPVRRFQADVSFWHPLSQLTVAFGKTEITYFSHHAQPVGKVEEFGDVREVEAARLVEVMHSLRYAVLAKDCNGLGAALGADGAYLDVAPEPALLAANGMTADEQAFVLNRRPAEMLQEGGLVDLVVHPHLRRPHWRHTTAHRPTREGGQRLDRFYVTPALARFVRAWRTVHAAISLAASDHLPVVMKHIVPQ